jgi:hypothetical protein
MPRPILYPRQRGVEPPGCAIGGSRVCRVMRTGGLPSGSAPHRARRPAPQAPARRSEVAPRVRRAGGGRRRRGGFQGSSAPPAERKRTWPRPAARRRVRPERAPRPLRPPRPRGSRPRRLPPAWRARGHRPRARCGRARSRGRPPPSRGWQGPRSARIRSTFGSAGRARGQTRRIKNENQALRREPRGEGQERRLLRTMNPKFWGSTVP